MATFEVSLKDDVSGPAKKASMGMTELASKVTLLSKAFGVAASLGGALFKLGKFIVAAGESEQATQGMLNALAGGPEAGAKMMEVIDRLKNELPIAKDRLAEMSKELMSAGIRSAPELEKALRATTAASIIMGETGAAKITALISKVELLGESGKSVKNLAKALQGTGIDVEDLARQLGKPAKQLDAMLKSGQVSSKALGAAIQDAMIAKGGPAIAQANNKLGTLVERAKEGLTNMFEGIVDTPGFRAFIEALKQLLNFFGTAETASDNMTTRISSGFNVVFGVVAKVVTWMQIGFLKLIALGLRLYLWLFPFLKKLKEWWGMIKESEAFKTVMDALWLTLKVLGYALLVVVGVMVAWVGIMAAIVGAVILVIAYLYNLAVKGLAALGEWISGAMDAASDFIDGLVDGIKSGAKWVIDAVKNLGASALKAFKGVLGISSPSKIMMRMGVHMGEGLEGGLDSSQASVANSAKDLGSAAAGGVAAAPAPSRAASGSSSGGGVTVNVEPGAIVVNGAGKSGEEISEEMISLLFERIALQSGVPA